MNRSTVLWVTDNPSTMSAIRDPLESAGYELLLAANAAEAIALAFIGRRVCAIVLDQRMRDRAGLRLARVLRSLRADLPVILISPTVMDPLPACIDACLCVGHEADSLVPILNAVTAVSWRQDSREPAVLSR